MSDSQHILPEDAFDWIVGTLPSHYFAPIRSHKLYLDPEIGTRMKRWIEVVIELEYDIETLTGIMPGSSFRMDRKTLISFYFVTLRIIIDELTDYLRSIKPGRIDVAVLAQHDDPDRYSYVVLLLNIVDWVLAEITKHYNKSLDGLLSAVIADQDFMELFAPVYQYFATYYWKEYNKDSHQPFSRFVDS